MIALLIILTGFWVGFASVMASIRYKANKLLYSKTLAGKLLQNDICYYVIVTGLIFLKLSMGIWFLFLMITFIARITIESKLIKKFKNEKVSNDS